MEQQNKNIIRRYLESIVAILEDRPQYQFSLMIYKMILFISYFQIGVYLFENYTNRRMEDYLMSSITKILQFISLNTTLIIQDSDAISLVCFLFSQIFLYTYFTYVLMFTIVKNYFQELYELYSSYLGKINRILNLYFCLYVNVFFNYQLEMSTSVIFCSEKSLFSSQRITDQIKCNIPTWQLSIGVIGLVLCGITAMICLFFFRNYEFHEENLMKRKLSNIFVITTFLKMIITIIQHSDLSLDQRMLFKYILLIAFGVLSLFDATFNNTYQHRELIRFNIFMASTFLSVVIIFNLWIYTTLVRDKEIFYLLLIKAVVIGSFFQALDSYRYEKCMNSDIYEAIDNTTKSRLSALNYQKYLSELVKLAKESTKNEVSKIRIQKIICQHIQICKLKTCFCFSYKLEEQEQIENSMNVENAKKRLFLNNNSRDIDIDAIYKVTDSIFRWLLEQKQIQEKQSEYEYLTLQYITFMIKCQNNHTRANYYLKLLVQRRKQRGAIFSTYFMIITQILSDSMEKIISSMNENFLSSKRKEELTMKHIMLADKVCYDYMPIFQEILKQKQSMWTKMQNGFTNMNQFEDEAIKLMEFIKKIKDNFIRSIQVLQKNKDFNYCLTLKKLTLLFHLLALNDTLRAVELEEDVTELRKRDAFMEEDCLNNENLVKKNIITVTISISQNIGKIISQKDYKTAEFFGYSQQEFQRINKINDLMPQFIGLNHDSFLNSFVKRGSSKYIKSSISTFCINNLGYVLPIKIYSDFSFLSLDDFYLSGTILKVDKGSQYLLFDRNGRILGMSQQLGEKLVLQSEIMRTLPIADNLCKQLNAFTLFPRILKKLLKKREDILAGYVSQSQEIIHQDEKGVIHFDTNILNETNEFSNFLEKTDSSFRNSKKMKKTATSLTSSKSYRNMVQFDLLDVLDKGSHKKYNTFKKAKVNQMSYTDNFSSTADYSFNKNAEALLVTKLISQQPKAKQSQAKRLLEVERDQYKLNFKYVLSYHTLPFITKQQTQSSVNTNLSAKTNSEQEKANETQHEKDNSRAFYFSLRINDIKFQEILKKANSESKKASLQHQIVKQMKSITCINTIEKYFSPSITFQNYITEYDNDQEIIGEQNFNRQESHQTTQNRSIPKQYLQFLNIRNNSLLNMKGNTFKKQKEEIKNLNNKIEEGEKYFLTTSENQTQSINSTSEYSSTNQSGNESITESVEQMVGEFQNSKQKNNQILKQINEKYEEFTDSRLDQLLQENKISVQDLVQIDPFYKARRIISKNTHSSKFISTLELAIAEALIQIKEEKNNQNILHDEGSSQIISETTENPNLVNNYPMTFRNEQDKFDLPYQVRQITSEIYQNNQNQTRMIDDSHQHYFDELKPSKKMANQTFNFAINLADSSYNDIVNVSHRPLQQNLDASSDNLTSNIRDQASNYFTTNYTKPKFLKAQDLNAELNQDESLIAPSSFNDRESGYKIKLPHSENIVQQNPQKNQIASNNSHNAKNDQNKMISKNIKTMASTHSGKNKKEEMDKNSQQIENQLQYNKKEQSKYNGENQINFITSSGSSNFEDKKQKGTQITHEKVMNDLLNQGGLKEGKIDIGSVHSSSKSSSFYGGYFLKEIIKKNKIPYGAKTYSLILIIFTCLFLGLNLANLMIINNDMQDFATNVVVIRFPRRFTRDYCKTIYSYFLKIQLESGFLIDTPTTAYKNLSDSYRNSGAAAYSQLFDANQRILVSYGLKQQQENEIFQSNITYYQDFAKYSEQYDTSMMFKTPLYYLFGIQKNQTVISQKSSYLTLLSNFFNFSRDAQNFVLFVFGDTLSTVDNLILKFQFICIAAIISLIILPIFSIPVAKQINKYEEKILLIVSRINYDHSSVERQKLQICEQLLTLENYDWLKYSYHELFFLRYNQFDISVVNSNHDLSLLSSTHRYDSRRIKKKSTLNNESVMKSTKLQIDQSSKIKESSHSKKQNKNVQMVKNILNGNYTRPEMSLSNYQKGNEDIRNSKQNCVLQSKIQDQKLSVFYRIRTLLIFMCILVSYFLVVIIYLNLNTDLLKQPVNINKKTNLMHFYATRFQFATEMLSFDPYVKAKYWPLYNQENTQQFYYDTMVETFSLMQQTQLELTDIIYGNNPYNATASTTMKNLMEGYVCPYLVKNKCTGDIKQKTEFGIYSVTSNFGKLLTSYEQILNPNNPRSENDIRSYINSNERIRLFLKLFTTQDEVLDLFSSNANGNIGVVSLQIQNFLEQYLTYCGSVLVSVMFLVFVFSWKRLYRNIQLINFFLTFIPEEKLLEEVTLHLLKSLRKM